MTLCISCLSEINYEEDGGHIYPDGCVVCWSRIDHPAYYTKINEIMSRDLEEVLNGK